MSHLFWAGVMAGCVVLNAITAVQHDGWASMAAAVGVVICAGLMGARVHCYLDVRRCQR